MTAGDCIGDLNIPDTPEFTEWTCGESRKDGGSPAQDHYERKKSEV